MLTYRQLAASLIVLLCVPVVLMAEPPGPGWKLVFEDDFTGTEADPQWAPTRSRPLRVPSALQVARSIDAAMNLTDPSAMITWTPPG